MEAEWKLKETINNISLSGQQKERIYQSIHVKYERELLKYRHRKTGICTVSVLAVMLFLVCSLMLNHQTDINLTVYAATDTGRKSISLLETKGKVKLLSEETPYGTGYVFKIDIPQEYDYRCVRGKENLDLMTIYEKEDSIYWIPNHPVSGNVYDKDNKILEEPDIASKDTCTFNIEIRKENEEIEKIVEIQFSIIDNQCYIELVG